MGQARIASRYANSLYNQASEKKSLEKVVADIRHLNELTAQSREFTLFLESPLIRKEVKTQILHKIFGSFHEETRGLFDLMNSKSRENLIAYMGHEFMRIYNEKNGITEVEVTSASALDKDNLRKIEQFVKSQTGANSIEIKTKINPRLIGGLVIMFGGKIYDSSISSQIKKMKKEFKIA